MARLKKISKGSKEICSAVGGLKVAKGKPPHWPIGCFDGQEWAREFCDITGFKDEGLMLSWFATAIMTGYDEGRRREKEEADKREALAKWKRLRREGKNE